MSLSSISSGSTGTILQECTAAISALNKSATPDIQARLDNLTKPRGSLGRLEDLALRLTLISMAAGRGNLPQADPARIYTCAADHGVAARGVSKFPQEVTRQMVFNFLNGGAAVNVFTRSSDVELRVVDVGVKGADFADTPGLLNRKIAQGTADISAGPAMSLQECISAVELGISLAEQAANEGIRVVGTGEMGIANTTAATALYCAYLDLPPETITGPGTGLNEQEIRHKAGVVGRALQTNHVELPPADPMRTLAALGGLEIACLSGLILGCARRKLAVVIDGFISTAAYVAAWKIHPSVGDYAFFAHGSAEPGHSVILHHLRVRPILDLGMRLGEGTGVALAIPILRAAAAMYNNMASFADAGVSGSDDSA
ncbi:nicotinate-nucleotide-dimethylbenzimidazole phosphoribosyltransferase [Desulfonatronum thiosulfatophilum]|uniref:Nicotinate-nucleotide--dimethylbenzimidazole phosphoribosyltransferase n=1 Tax=Desulfonatronum thiosulfatophilum TaxID=617002 RepID=A0A1G6D6L1_9BACT|nr:nicotinate-nucleotide--dimethylbenzimidazole phosphoribosyltransferase [Desulfonatronum thiosulfatophilum]SDB40806.1 nicotinate-nucleotide-dimethylbenzimidazole phosphoribosyltransferase [Desulfonatronum thiosulfatophilum]